MTSKVIKKIFRVLLWFIGVSLFLFISFYFAFRSPAFQTWAADRVAGYFSSHWGAKVRVEGVDIEFWKKVVLEGVYVEDQRHDTLLYAGELKLDIGEFDRDSDRLFISDAVLKDATVKLKEYKGDSALNLQFILDEFARKDTAPKTGPDWKIGIGGITLDQVRFAYRQENDTSSSKGINFSNLLVQRLEGKISNIRFSGDTTFCTIERLSLAEKSGFRLNDLHAETAISPVRLQADQLSVVTDNTRLSGKVSFAYSGYNDFTHFVDSMRIRASFRSSNIEMADIAYFSDPLYGIRKKVFLDGRLSGKVGDFKGKDIVLAIGDETSFRGDFSMTGLPDIDRTFMSFDAKELRTSKAGIEKIPLPPFDTPNNISLPENVSLFGTIKFKGNFSGFYNDFVAYGKFSTALGQISTDISLSDDSLHGSPRYEGKFACTAFNLGKFFASEKYLGKISVNVNLSGKGLKKEDANLTLEGTAGSLELNGYQYRNINVKGKFARDIFDGTLAVNDENLIFDFSGNMDFSKRPTRVNFTSDIRKANLNPLNLMKQAEPASVTAAIEVNAVGNTLDDVTGQMKLNRLLYFKGARTFDFGDLVLGIREESGEKNLVLNSSVADAKLQGKFKPTEIVSCLNDLLAEYLPSFITGEEGREPANAKKSRSKKHQEHVQKFSFQAQLKNTDMVTGAFLPSWSLSLPASLTGRFDEEKNDFYFSGFFPQVAVSGYKFKKCSITAQTKNNQFLLETDIHRLAFSDSVWIDSLALATLSARDTLHFMVDWRNRTAVKYEGELPGYISFSDKGRMKLKFLPSSLTIADSTWAINPENEIVKDSSSLTVKNMEFSCGRQRIMAEGTISHAKEDQLRILLASFSLADFNTGLKGSGFSVYGTISGNASVANLYDNPVFQSSIDIRRFTMNNELIGDGSLVSLYDSRKEAVNFNGQFQREDAGKIKLAGDYFPFRKDSSLHAAAEVRDFHLEFFNPFVKEIMKDIRGSAGAELKITGTPDKPEVAGVIHAKVNNLFVNYLGTNYHFAGDVPVNPGSFDLSSLVLYDANNNPADVVNGKIYHTNFSNFQFDVDLQTQKFLCLNTTEKDNSTYYGKFFATGIINIFGPLDKIDISASAKTDKAKNVLGKNEYTQLFIPLSGTSEVSESGFISFVKNDTLKNKRRKYNVNASQFTMDLKVEATPDAQVQIIFDEKVGDIIKANGKGSIEMTMDQFGEFKMYGEYTVEEGDYLFTLKNVVNKRFKLRNGGTIRWAGDPKEALINMSASYDLRTSLSPLFYTYEQTDLVKKRYPVSCVMNINGKLLSPEIAFDIQIPTADDFTRQLAYDRFKNSELEVNRQAFSLLFTNSFTVPSDRQGESAGGPGYGAVTSTEMLTDQLSNWLSQISNKVDVGVHYRPGDVVNKDEVQVALSTQLFNDKMTIDGSVANNASTTSQNTSNIVGDINVDYKLTEDGKVRAKAYNHTNEGDILNIQKGPYTQGVGIFYREEFETVGELYRRFMNKVSKKNKPEQAAAP